MKIKILTDILRNDMLKVSKLTDMWWAGSDLFDIIYSLESKYLKTFEDMLVINL